MLKKRLITFFLSILVILVFFTALYRCCFVQLKTASDVADKPHALFLAVDQLDQSKPATGGYGFGRMMVLVEACQKVKDLEYLFMSKAINETQITSQTICELIKSLAQERMRFVHHIDNLKSRAQEPLSSKKMRSLSYYLHVLEESIQDMEMIVTNRTLPIDRK